jgi:hypothetical protein
MRHHLSTRRVAALLRKGQLRRYGDGSNLYLQVNGPDRGAWVLSAMAGSPRLV